MAFKGFNDNFKKSMFEDSSRIVILDPDGYVHDGTLLFVYRKTRSIKGLEFSEVDQFSGYISISEKVYKELIREMIILK